MKKSLLLITTICYFITAQGQLFSFKMFFIDAIGDKDTITLGYDLLATDSIDLTFGEINKISTPLDSRLDVRITNEFYNRTRFNMPGSYHTKKQIIYYYCPVFKYENIQTIDIHTKHWPVTATWNNSLFTDSCRNGSVFTSFNPGGWWDVGSPSNLRQQVLGEKDSVTFSSNTFGGYNENYSYIKGLDTIPVFWLGIGNEYILYTSINEISKKDTQLKAFPNPTTGNLTVEVAQDFGNINSIQIFSSTGNQMMISKTTHEPNISQLEKGLYFILITNEKGKTLCTRILKE
ncbi:MAG: T9SS type A sorting domain-containing protein [Saprospiraceae bacterium]|nr:T9SS type A sorting domain-containing protein [Saprospiraceae bacterium]MBK9721240.1 T9SS type A sorting domain-containing protein [Saprospiraceae bacterium]